MKGELLLCRECIIVAARSRFARNHVADGLSLYSDRWCRQTRAVTGFMCWQRRITLRRTRFRLCIAVMYSSVKIVFRHSLVFSGARVAA